MAVWTFIVGQTKTLAVDAEFQAHLLSSIERIPLPRALFNSDPKYDSLVTEEWKSGKNENNNRFVFYKEVREPIIDYPVQIIFQNDLVIIIGPNELFQMYFYFAEPENFERRDLWLNYAEQLFKVLGFDKLVVITEFEEEDFPDYASFQHFLSNSMELTHSINEYTTNKTYVREI